MRPSSLSVFAGRSLLRVFKFLMSRYECRSHLKKIKTVNASLAFDDVLRPL